MILKPLLFPVQHPHCFWTLGLILSLYYGWRGWRIQKLKRTYDWPNKDNTLVQCVQDSIFNFVCSIAGFAALYMECKIFLSIPSLSEIGVGTAIILMFLAILAVAGISGTLPLLLVSGKLPMGK